jgi:hypothetical protein
MSLVRLVPDVTALNLGERVLGRVDGRANVPGEIQPRDPVGCCDNPWGNDRTECFSNI